LQQAFIKYSTAVPSKSVTQKKVQTPARKKKRKPTFSEYLLFLSKQRKEQKLVSLENFIKTASAEEFSVPQENGS
jgi:hypothetical protein